jgi:hypothetical protein
MFFAVCFLDPYYRDMAMGVAFFELGGLVYGNEK